MYSASRSLMARISDNVKGSGFWAQLTGQFAVEEMISVTRACRSTGVGRAMVFPSLIVDLLRIYKSHRPRKFSGFDGYEGVARGAHAAHRTASTNVCSCGFANGARTEAGVMAYYRIRAEVQKLFSPTRWFAGDRSDWRTQIKWAAVLVQ